MKRIRQIIFVGMLGMLVGVLSCSDKNKAEAKQPEAPKLESKPAAIAQPSAKPVTTVSPAEAANPGEAVAGATRRLNDTPNYSWATSTVEADGSASKLGTIQGKAEKGGVTWLSFVVSGLPVSVCKKGDKGAANALAGWQTFDELAQMGGTAAAVVRYLRSYQAPAGETAMLAGKVKELKAADGAIAGELKDDAVQELLLMGSRQREGQEPPKTTDAKGAIKFWIQNGALTKVEIKVSGKITAGDKESVINRTTTVEIKDVGTTKIEVPDEAKAKLT